MYRVAALSAALVATTAAAVLVLIGLALDDAERSEAPEAAPAGRPVPPAEPAAVP